MSGIPPPIMGSFLLSPRTANYVAALIREGDNFDFYKWPQKVREEQAQAKGRPQTITSGKIASVEIDSPIGTPVCRKASPNWTLLTRRGPIPAGMPRSYCKPIGSTSGSRITRRLQEIRNAWADFQASRARDAVYGYLGDVFDTVMHYKMRRRTKKLLRQAFKFADLPFDKTADPFSAVIRCTCDDNIDSKTISKWARALRYAARSKEPAVRLRTFMKRAGGVNACADLYARYFGRDTR